MKNKKTVFYIVCGLILGVPYLWKLIVIIPELLASMPNLAEVLAALGYTAFILVSLVIAYRLNEHFWVRLIGVYGMTALVITVLSMIFDALKSFEVFTVLFSLVSAPYVGIKSPVSIIVLMMVIVITSYITLNKMPEEAPKQK